jgi:hypothetical protein
MLIPFLYVHLDPLLAVKVLYLILGAISLVGVVMLSQRFQMDGRIRMVVLALSVPIILFFSLYLVTPDFLLVCILVFYFNTISKATYSHSVRGGVFCGLLGGVAYLSKAYALPFFIVSFLFFNICHYFTTTQRKRVVESFLFGLVCFVVVSGIWISALTGKYGEFTISTAGKYNYAIVSSESKGELVHPFDTQGLFDPPNPSAISIWEDPSHLQVRESSPFESFASLKHQFMMIIKNISLTVGIYQDFSVLSITVIIVYVALFLNTTTRQVLSQESFFSFVSIFLFPLGYMFIQVQHRYLWIGWILLLLLGGQVVTALSKVISDKSGKRVMFLLFVLAFIKPPVSGLIQSVNEGKDIYDLSAILRDQYGIRGNIASNGEWLRTLFLVYYLDATEPHHSRYFGVTKKNITAADLKNTLREKNIQFYFCWDGFRQEDLFLANRNEITNGQISGLRIYSFKQSAD